MVFDRRGKEGSLETPGGASWHRSAGAETKAKEAHVQTPGKELALRL